MAGASILNHANYVRIDFRIFCIHNIPNRVFFISDKPLHHSLGRLYGYRVNKAIDFQTYQRKGLSGKIWRGGQLSLQLVVPIIILRRFGADRIFMSQHRKEKNVNIRNDQKFGAANFYLKISILRNAAPRMPRKQRR